VRRSAHDGGVGKHRFTPAEANRTLPLVKRVVGDLLATGRELRELAPRHADPGVRARLGVLEAAIRELTDELARIGCSYKDWGFELGLVDFPALIDGHEVLLCWRSDEERLEWFHATDAGFAGRTRIPSELLAQDQPAPRRPARPGA
jgi:hypothetical protein